jgi:hypothetical protein
MGQRCSGALQRYSQIGGSKGRFEQCGIRAKCPCLHGSAPPRMTHSRLRVFRKQQTTLYVPPSGDLAGAGLTWALEGSLVHAGGSLSAACATRTTRVQGGAPRFARSRARRRGAEEAYRRRGCARGVGAGGARSRSSGLDVRLVGWSVGREGKRGLSPYFCEGPWAADSSTRSHSFTLQGSGRSPTILWKFWFSRAAPRLTPFVVGWTTVAASCA